MCQLGNSIPCSYSYICWRTQVDLYNEHWHLSFVTLSLALVIADCLSIWWLPLDIVIVSWSGYSFWWLSRDLMNVSDLVIISHSNYALSGCSSSCEVMFPYVLSVPGLFALLFLPIWSVNVAKICWIMFYLLPDNSLKFAVKPTEIEF